MSWARLGDSYAIEIDRSPLRKGSFVKKKRRLLRSALHALTARVSILVIVISHATTVSEHPVLAMGIELLEIGRLGHVFARGHVRNGRRRQDLSQRLEGFLVLGPVLLRELDVEVDVQVAVIVVARRRHTLAANHSDSVWYC
jgi:hypothetical protein